MIRCLPPGKLKGRCVLLLLLLLLTFYSRTGTRDPFRHRWSQSANEGDLKVEARGVGTPPEYKLDGGEE